MAKILFALAAALCVFVAVNATPAHHHLQVVQDKVHMTDLQSLDFFNDLSVEQSKWMNVTEILEKIEEALSAVETKIAEVSKRVEDVVEAILEGIQNSAQEVAGNWNQTINEWADKAAQAGVDVQDCIDQQPRTIADVAEDLKADAKKCIADYLDDLNEALNNVKAVGTEARELLEVATTKVTECAEKENVFATGVCLGGVLPPLQIEAWGLVTKATWRISVVGGKAAAVVPLATLCTSKATAGRAAEATTIANATVSCIKAKLGQ